jgi:hypothetical protein
VSVLLLVQWAGIRALDRTPAPIYDRQPGRLWQPRVRRSATAVHQRASALPINCLRLITNVVLVLTDLLAAIVHPSPDLMMRFPTPRGDRIAATARRLGPARLRLARQVPRQWNLVRVHHHVGRLGPLDAKPAPSVLDQIDDARRGSRGSDLARDQGPRPRGFELHHQAITKLSEGLQIRLAPC